MIFYSLHPRADLVHRENRALWQVVVPDTPPLTQQTYRYGYEYTKEQALELAQAIEDNDLDLSKGLEQARENLINFLRKSGGFKVW